MTQRRQILSSLLVLGSVGTLAGCARRILPEGSDRTQGSFALSLESDEKKEQIQGRYEILENKKAGTLSFEIINPLGATQAVIRLDKKGASLEQGGKTTSAATGEQLMQRVLGFSLPLSVLTSWLKGVPDPQYESVRVNDDAFAQEKWRITVHKRYLSGTPRVFRIENLVWDRIRITLVLSVVLPEEW